MAAITQWQTQNRMQSGRVKSLPVRMQWHCLECLVHFGIDLTIQLQSATSYVCILLLSYKYLLRPDGEKGQRAHSNNDSIEWTSKQTNENNNHRKISKWNAMTVKEKMKRQQREREGESDRIPLQPQRCHIAHSNNNMNDDTNEKILKYQLNTN